MASVVETVVATVTALQAALLVLTGLQLTGYKWPPSENVANGTTCDIIIIGAGSAGSIIANRLTEVPGLNIIMVEEGGDPPVESVLPGIFPLLVNSATDFNFTSEDDGYSCQNCKGNHAWLTAGKMLGGSTSLSHMNYIRGNPYDYKKWVEATGDETWSYENLLPYFLKTEKVEDPEILASESAQFHGTDGLLRLNRQKFADNAFVFQAFEELGVKEVLNINEPSFTVGIAEPMLTIADGYRQSAAEAYLRPLAERSNFHLLKNSKVTKILIDDNKIATGVEVKTAAGETITINANLEVVVTAGVFSTPQLLMLSGIGPSEHLASFDIPVISDLPVGQNLQDHIPAVIVHSLAPGEPLTAPADPHLFPVPITIGYSALDLNQAWSDYQTINLVFPADNTAQIQICSIVFGYKDEICQAFFDGGAGKSTFMSIASLAQPESRGEVLLRSADPTDTPLIRHGIYSSDNDLKKMGLILQDFARIVNTTVFQDMGAAMIEVNLPECNDMKRNTVEYFECYALHMSGTMWVYGSTCAMGKVLDNTLMVKGVQRLRVADASAMPNIISGNANPAVMVLAERAADLIKATYGPSPRS